MKKHLLLLILLSVGIISFSTAQVQSQDLQNKQKHRHGDWCGVSYEDGKLINARMKRNRVELANTVITRGVIQWVPIKFHIVGNDVGGDHVSEMKIFEALCAINEDYLAHEIQFYIKDASFQYINSDVANTAPQTFAGNFQLGNARVNNAMNIFVVKNITNDPDDPTTLGYYDPNTGRDWIVVQRDQVTALAAETLTHEIGHFFDLNHPFWGWEGSFWTEAAGIPVGPISPNGQPNEYVNGTNCANSGDEICDTYANYGLGFGANSCNYQGNCQDPNGELLSTKVQEENYMAYFIGCATEFTPGQVDVMLDDMNTSARNYLGIGNVTPESAAITEAPELVEPINGESTPLYNVVEFDWEPVAGATHYLLEVDKTETFAFAPTVKVVTGTSTLLEDVFEDDKTYHWRVKPFNLGHPCGPISVVQEFRTGNVSAINEIASVKEWKVSPNPILTNQILNVEVITDSSFDADVKIFNAAGKLVKVQAHTFVAGASTLALDVEQLSSGIYLLHVESEVGVLNEKIVVTK